MIKLAIPVENDDIFQHFGHAAQFRIFSIDAGAVQSAETVTANGEGHDAVAAFLKEQGADLVICGGIGDGAQNALAEHGIVLYSGVSGKAEDAAKAFLSGTLEYDKGATCTQHGEGGCSGCSGSCSGCSGCDDCGEHYVETRTFTEILHLTYDNFEKEVLQDPGLICIDFWADWCQPCKMMAPLFEEVNKEQPKVKFCKINVDEEQELAKLFGIESIPTIVLVQNRRTLTGFVGVRNKESLSTMIESYLR